MVQPRDGDLDELEAAPGWLGQPPASRAMRRGVCWNCQDTPRCPPAPRTALPLLPWENTLRSIPRLREGYVSSPQIHW